MKAVDGANVTLLVAVVFEVEGENATQKRLFKRWVFSVWQFDPILISLTHQPRYISTKCEIIAHHASSEHLTCKHASHRDRSSMLVTCPPYTSTPSPTDISGGIAFPSFARGRDRVCKGRQDLSNRLTIVII
ncbi:hypothetical protein BV22DRAFT_933251 [Leucogyrophana mollusca]|uniref:Uncharacterized protein n=1 Tax=Leucogyrophana mollusca TaxID=85980 RepID=A0ACB8AXK9_9AGAM|nr:hypothetical protein BV22DRAFT_933251 [Leucogyrophana mollusca]